MSWVCAARLCVHIPARFISCKVSLTIVGTSMVVEHLRAACCDQCHGPRASPHLSSPAAAVQGVYSDETKERERLLLQPEYGIRLNAGWREEGEAE